MLSRSSVIFAALTVWLVAQASFWFAASANAQGIEHLQGLNNPDYHLVASKVLERDFHIHVRLPENYDNATINYPVVYLLDGGMTFPILASYYRYLFFGEEVPELIIVGISYGNDDWGGGNMRGTDFTAAAESRASYGGAPRFQNFLETELLPLIEGKYRADPGRRIIFGQSLGGQFVLYTALHSPELFWGHIASNPALHRNLAYFLEFHSDMRSQTSRLFVSDGTLKDLRFRDPVKAWVAHWSAVKDKPWRLKTIDLEGESHMSAAPAAFRNGLRWLFSAESP